jgi:transposase-like protein
MPEGIVLIVSADADKVEADLAAGAVPCPACRGPLARWGHARRRMLRGGADPLALHPRRGRCRSCQKTHVLLPDVVFLRRVDAAPVIGQALLAAAEGKGHRRIARAVERPADTVRGWLRRARAAAERMRNHFSSWALALDPTLAPLVPAGSALADALEAIAVAARAASLRLGVRPVWSWAVALSAGTLLSNTNCPWPAP